jgi:hypothetical protein
VEAGTLRQQFVAGVAEVDTSAGRSVNSAPSDGERSLSITAGFKTKAMEISSQRSLGRYREEPHPSKPKEA